MVCVARIELATSAMSIHCLWVSADTSDAQGTTLQIELRLSTRSTREGSFAPATNVRNGWKADITGEY